MKATLESQFIGDILPEMKLLLLPFHFFTSTHSLFEHQNQSIEDIFTTQSSYDSFQKSPIDSKFM